MPHSESNSANPLAIVLGRSDELYQALFDLLEPAEFDPSKRGQASVGMCAVAMEHGLSLKTLVAVGSLTSAVSLMRLQFEALVRAMWIMYAASDLQVAKILAPLTVESEQAAKNLPTVNGMILEIGKQVGLMVPARAYQMLAHFRDAQLKALNSFVHGGIHSLRRHIDGFPLPLALEVIRSSNALTLMTGMTLAVLSCNENVSKPIRGMQRQFEDCLPTLLR